MGPDIVDIHIELSTRVIASPVDLEMLAEMADVMADDLAERVRALQAFATMFIEQHPSEAEAARRSGQPLSLPQP